MSAPHTLDAYDFALPDALIAQEAVEPRDSARLLLVGRGGGVRGHHIVRELPALLPKGALLVVNDTRVVPARLLGHKADSGGRVELLLVEPFASPGDGLRAVRAICRSSKPMRVGQRLDFGDGVQALVRDVHGGGEITVDLDGAADLDDALARVGRLPLPPYLRGGREDDAGHDRVRYQTAWAARPGAVAAPTAGLHFTPALLDALASEGIGRVAVTLHVGPGTFLPVRTGDIREHRVLAERFEVDAEVADAIARARSERRPVIAVGTTATRVLETLGRDGIRACRGSTDLTILPGARFEVVDGLMTNFHLPRSSLLLLLAAFAGYETTMAAYREAVAQGYRFYSYGDASLWL
ncbi:MAG: hypothetical protein RIT45_805 [Pseudomonadota bacterium]|jgi:S-adenosylmethionine:tRNA ribosyltransferase-isomerase